MSAAVANDVRYYAVIFGRELGVLAVLIAVLGLLASLIWRRTIRRPRPLVRSIRY
jgi:hypothetical protein